MLRQILTLVINVRPEDQKVRFGDYPIHTSKTAGILTSSPSGASNQLQLI